VAQIGGYLGFSLKTAFGFFGKSRFEYFYGPNHFELFVPDFIDIRHATGGKQFNDTTVSDDIAGLQYLFPDRRIYCVGFGSARLRRWSISHNKCIPEKLLM
jgi:hypothetical protein